MIMFIWSFMTFTMTTDDYYQDQSISSGVDDNIRLIIDIPAGMSYACVCPDSCDDSECTFVNNPMGPICTGQCSSGEGYVDCDPFGEQTTEYHSDTEESRSEYANPCMSSCMIEERSHSAVDYEPWKDRILGR